ncbi:MAG: DUF3370 family protein [Cyanobacteriota bacterium]|nr:DUF3370 family protein [Cyanobacteriota bacterium]
MIGLLPQRLFFSPAVLAAFDHPSPRLLPGLALGGLLLLGAPVSAQSYVALMDGQRAVALRGRFNRVPVLHSNQPEEVEGPGILISTVPGTAIAAENGMALQMPAYTFNGDFGLHLHHKYFPPYRASISPSGRRGELTLAAILINPSVQPVRVRFSAGAVRNSFEAPYLANHLLGVKPLGPRPWNTGPGDATAVQLLRGRLDPKLEEEIVIPSKSRMVLFRTALPALGIANALLKGRSDGPLQIAVVAAKDPQEDGDILAVMDSGRLAPGRVYLGRIPEIEAGTIFSRVGGVAMGDLYQASLEHDLTRQGPLHVPLTSTVRTHFGTGEVQVNPLASRIVDSSLDNVGTYGVRFDIDLNLQGQGTYDLVMSHPSPLGGRPFTAFRGSMEIRTPEGLQSLHVGLRSGQSLSLTQLQLQPGRPTPVRLSLVYPADSTPGHLLSVVPAAQLAQLQDQERRQEMARLQRSGSPLPTAPPTLEVPPAPGNPPAPPNPGTKPPGAAAPAVPRAKGAGPGGRRTGEPPRRPRPRPPGPLVPPPEILRTPSLPTWLQPPPDLQSPPPQSQQRNPLEDRYREALEAQDQLLRQWRVTP